MKKLLLVGELGEIVQSLNECLNGDFQVQICVPQLEEVQGMIKITKPDLIVFCEIGIDEIDTTILKWIHEKYCKLPVLIITSSEKWRIYSDLLENRQFDKLFRPFIKSVLLNKCYQMLHLNEIEYKYNSFEENKKILLVDDSALMLRGMKSILDKKYTVFLATSGEMALKMIPQKMPDLILLDYEMPGMDGKATFEAILEDEFAKDIPVIFLTSIADRKQVYAVLKSAPAGYILKPPDSEKLLSAIEEVFAQKEEWN